jgi:hypothetical protein
VLADVRAAMGYLRSHSAARIGMVGFSLGGHIAYLAATQLDLAATAVFYGGWIVTGDIPLSQPEPMLSLTPGIAGRLLFLIGAGDLCSRLSSASRSARHCAPRAFVTRSSCIRTRRTASSATSAPRSIAPRATTPGDACASCSPPSSKRPARGSPLAAQAPRAQACRRRRAARVPRSTSEREPELRAITPGNRGSLHAVRAVADERPVAGSRTRAACDHARKTAANRTQFAQEARAELAAALPAAEVGEPDDVGVFEVALDADDREDALTRTWDAVAASGTDDHIVILEHPDLPEHWRRFSGRPVA